MVVVSAAAGLVDARARLAQPLRARRGRRPPLAVAAIVAGWALAQAPNFLPGLTISEAAAGRSTLIAVVVAVALGALVLVPSLILLFTLFLRGHLDEAGPRDLPEHAPRPGGEGLRHLRAAVVLALLLAGVSLMVLGGFRLDARRRDRLPLRVRGTRLRCRRRSARSPSLTDGDLGRRTDDPKVVPSLLLAPDVAPSWLGLR